LALILLSVFTGHQDLSAGDTDVQFDHDAGDFSADHDIGMDGGSVAAHAGESGAWLLF